jgi:NADH-quinone oxidoreductase subunit G
LGNLLGLSGFDWNSSEDILKAHWPGLQPFSAESSIVNGLGQSVSCPTVALVDGNQDSVPLASGQVAVELASFVPLYDVDAVVRRAPSLRQTKAAKPAVVQMNANTLASLNVEEGSAVKVQDAAGGSVHGHVVCNPWVANDTVWVPVGRSETLGLRSLFGPVLVHVPTKLGAEVQA